jgi:rRNA maturation RNase YbeY
MIDFIYTTPFVLRNTEEIRKLLLHVSVQEGYTLSQFYFHFVSAEEITRINKNHLSHDYATDVITFDYSRDKELKAEAYVCPQEVKSNAKKYSQALENEMVRVLVHSLLHICGYDDKTDESKLKMRNKEDLYIKIYQTSFK